MKNDGQNMLTAEQWCGARCSVLTEFIDHLQTHRQNGAAANGTPQIVLREDVRRAFRQFVQGRPQGERRRLRSTLGGRIAQTEEIIFAERGTCIVLREEPGKRRAYLTGHDGEVVELLDERRFLSLRESIVLGRPIPDRFAFGIDFRSFRLIPTEAGTTADIGTGPVRVAELFREAVRSDPHTVLTRMIDYLCGRTADGAPILFSRVPSDVPGLRKHLHRALQVLAGRPAAEEIERSLPDLGLLGFATGWGRTAGRARETLALLERAVLDPTTECFLDLFTRLPLIRRMLLVSPHGWFAQSKVFGRPDTGGQVVYVLDQARALESHLRRLWYEAGIELTPRILILTRLIPEAQGTTCDRRLEKVKGSEDAWILRVPFRHKDGAEVPHWVSRFQVWPYLERFAHDAYGEVMTELGDAAPDVVVGNYSDGNTVASMLGREWRVPIAVIAHALEKTKYLMSDLYWRELENDYHFSIHFLADILAVNCADIIMTSSYEEIAGTPRELGQYESYEVFTLPERYRVFSGVNIHSARFMINPPGTNTSVFRPYTTVRRRETDAEREIEELIFGDAVPDSGIRGRLAAPDKPIVFTMARMDRIKNLVGLVQAYARRRGLRESVNLLILSGVTSEEESTDLEEREQIRAMYKAYEQHGLDDCVRWLPGRLGQHRVPHYYRLVARRRGIFAQPALFEAFGLTVIEAMASGLPVIATRFGGPASIIEDGVSGFLVDPNRASDWEKAVRALLEGRTDAGGDRWEAVSHAGIRRVHERFSWRAHSRRLVASCGLYGLGHHIFPDRRRARRFYVDALHHLLLNRLVEETWPAH